MIWESILDKTVDSDVLKKNISTPQFARLERRADTQADEIEKERNIAVNENIEAEKAPTDTEKDLLETEEANNYAEEAKVILYQKTGLWS